MKTNTIIGIVAAVVIVGGAAFYFSKGGSSQGGTADTQSAGTFSGSISDLSKRGGSWQCTVDTSTGSTASSGTVYVSGQNVRADFSVSVPSYGKVEAHMIATGGYTYSWSSAMPRGVKAKMTTQPSGSGPTSGQGVNVNTSYSYNCTPWSADQSKFSIPTEVTFTEVGN